MGDEMKFKKKSEIFDAEQYKPGMEDGFNYYSRGARRSRKPKGFSVGMKQNLAQ